MSHSAGPIANVVVLDLILAELVQRVSHGGCMEDLGRLLPRAPEQKSVEEILNGAGGPRRRSTSH